MLSRGLKTLIKLSRLQENCSPDENRVKAQGIARRKQNLSIHSDGKKLRKERIGLVVSNKMDKTITVQIGRKLKHPIYGKFVNKSSKLMAHDDKNECNIGDTVRLWKPGQQSKKKRWRLVEIIERAK